MSAQPVLQVQELKKHFPIRKGLAVRAVDGVSFEVREGEILGLVGESGSGKSTVAYTVVGMYRPTAGRVIFKGDDVSRESARRSLAQKGQMQIVFQDPGSSLNPRRTVRQILRLPLMVHGLARSESEKEEKAAELRKVRPRRRSEL